ncbi:unnamed protein product [Lampetra planeri]
MGDYSQRALMAACALSFVAGALLGWQGNKTRRRFLDWRKRRLQALLAQTQKKLDLA